LMIAAETGGRQQTQPSDTEPVKPKVDLTIIVTSENGGVDRLQVRNGNQIVDVKGGVNDLYGYLKNLRKEVPELGAQEEITIEASSKLEYSNLVYIMDVCLK